MTSFIASEIGRIFPELFIAVSGMVFLISGAIRGNKGTAYLCWGSVGCFILAALFHLAVDWEKAELFGGQYIVDPFSGFLKLLILLGLAATMVMSIRYLYEERIVRFEYPILVIFSGLGMMMMVSAGSLLTMYVGLELQSLCLYVLAAIHRDHVKSAEAGIKYFILGALASGMLLFGISLIYGYTGSIGFEAISQSLKASGSMPLGAVVGMVFILIGVAFKISSVPFHMWTPDVYEGAPTSVTALFAIVPKVAAMGLLIRLLYGPFGAMIGEWQQIIWFLAFSSMFVSAFAGLVQINIKRLMAYSSIGNMGYALMGVIAGSSEGIGAAIVYMTIYMIMSAGVFGIILTMRRGGMAAENIEDLSGLSKNNPIMAYAMAVLMFSMSGIPPMAGFFGKLLVFQVAVAQGFYILAVLGVLSSVVAAYYYLRVIKVMFFDEATDPFDTVMAFPRRTIVVLSILFTVFFIISPNGLVESSRAAAIILFAG